MVLNIADDDILKMGKQLLNLENLYKEYSENEVKNYLYCCKNHEYSFRDGIWCDFWNRGYPIKVTRVFLRKSDNSLMVGGINMANNREGEEFFCHLCNFRDIKQVVEQVIPSFAFYY